MKFKDFVSSVLAGENTNNKSRLEVVAEIISKSLAEAGTLNLQNANFSQENLDFRTALNVENNSSRRYHPLGSLESFQEKFEKDEWSATEDIKNIRNACRNAVNKIVEVIPECRGLDSHAREAMTDDIATCLIQSETDAIEALIDNGVRGVSQESFSNIPATNTPDARLTAAAVAVVKIMSAAEKGNHTRTQTSYRTTRTVYNTKIKLATGDNAHDTQSMSSRDGISVSEVISDPSQITGKSRRMVFDQHLGIPGTAVLTEGGGKFLSFNPPSPVNLIQLSIDPNSAQNQNVSSTTSVTPGAEIVSFLFKIKQGATEEFFRVMPSARHAKFELKNSDGTRSDEHSLNKDFVHSFGHDDETIAGIQSVILNDPAISSAGERIKIAYSVNGRLTISNGELNMDHGLSATSIVDKDGKAITANAAQSTFIGGLVITLEGYEILAARETQDLGQYVGTMLISGQETVSQMGPATAFRLNTPIANDEGKKELISSVQSIIPAAQDQEFFDKVEADLIKIATSSEVVKEELRLSYPSGDSIRPTAKILDLDLEKGTKVTYDESVDMFKNIQAAAESFIFSTAVDLIVESGRLTSSETNGKNQINLYAPFDVAQLILSNRFGETQTFNQKDGTYSIDVKGLDSPQTDLKVKVIPILQTKKNRGKIIMTITNSEVKGDVTEFASMNKMAPAIVTSPVSHNQTVSNRTFVIFRSDTDITTPVGAIIRVKNAATHGINPNLDYVP